MEEARKRKGFKKNVLTYRVGDLMWVKKAGGKTGAKVALSNEGPFELLGVLGSKGQTPTATVQYSVRRTLMEQQ